MSDRDKNWFKEVCSQNGLPLSDEKMILLDQYSRLLVSKNKEVNLISRTSEDFVWEEHILHSLSFLFLKNINPDSKILDLGTGGGLPGIPLKILFPNLELTLLDSTKKKIIAVNEMIVSLGLKKIIAVSERAEEINSVSKYNNKYDYVICRAVSSLKNILSWVTPFLKSSNNINMDNYIPFNSIIVLKGGDIKDEIKQIQNDKNIIKIEVVDLIYNRSDTLKNPDKKIVVIKLK